MKSRMKWRFDQEGRGLSLFFAHDSRISQPPATGRLSILKTAAGNKLKTIPQRAAFTGAIVGLLVLFGWIFGVEALKRIGPNFVAMNPITAVGFILTSTSLWFSCRREERAELKQEDFNKTIAKGCALAVALIGGSKLIGLWLGWSVGIDQFLFADKLGELSGGLPNRMAPNTALNFTLIGISLLSSYKETLNGNRIYQAAAWTAGLISALAIIGYAYGATSFYGVGVFIPMALHTAVIFLTLVVGILFLRPHSGLMGIIMHDGAGGHISRRILPATAVVLFVLGWLRLKGQQLEFYQTEVGIALLVACAIAVAAVLVLSVAAPLNRLDAERQLSEKQITKLNEDLQRRAEELEAANAELNSFSYSVSHDLRAPLRHIDGYIELLRERSEGALDEKSQRYLNVISNSAKDMATLIEDLLVFSRLGRAEMRQEPVYLDEVIDHVKRSHLPEAPSRNVEWQIKELPVVKGDRSMLRQVFVNLMSNALKYSGTRDRAKIEIDWERNSAGEIVVFVRDNGVGFDMKYADRLFGVFQRLHAAEEFEGTGIGLANVKRIIGRHGGRVWAEAKVNEGATFFVAFPKASEVPAARQPTTFQPESARTPAIEKTEQSTVSVEEKEVLL